MQLNGRGAVRWALRAYLRGVPIEVGKGRLLRLLGPIAAGSRDLVRCNYFEGMEIELDLAEYIQGCIYYRGYYEPDVVRVIRSLLRPGQDAIDIGANVGCFTLIMSSVVGPGGRVHAFEVDPRLEERLLRNIRLNRLANIVVNRMAVSDTSGTAEFYPSEEPGNCGLGSLRARKPNMIGFPCKKVSLDEYFHNMQPDRLDNVGLIKIDIEGGEWPALRSAGDLISRRPALVVEICDLLTDRFGYSSRDFVTWLRSVGYECYEIGRAELVPLGKEAGRQSGEIVCLDARASIPCI